jgi:Flp pilus assembly pilin Flp
MIDWAQIMSNATRLDRIGRCTRGATVVEYALAAALVATAAASVRSPRLHMVKGEACTTQATSCPTSFGRQAARPRTIAIDHMHGRDLPTASPTRRPKRA